MPILNSYETLGLASQASVSHLHNHYNNCACYYLLIIISTIIIRSVIGLYEIKHLNSLARRLAWVSSPRRLDAQGEDRMWGLGTTACWSDVWSRLPEDKSFLGHVSEQPKTPNSHAGPCRSISYDVGLLSALCRRGNWSLLLQTPQGSHHD